MRGTETCLVFLIQHWGMQNQIMDDDVIWDTKVRQRLESLLASAKWSPKKKTVTFELENDDGDSEEVASRSYDELQGALYDAGIGIFRSLSSEHDGGEDDFEFDDSMIEELLQDHYSEQMQQLGWEI